MKKFKILEKLSQNPVIGDGGTIFELERRGYIKFFVNKDMAKHKYI